MEDYTQAGADDLALGSRLSAASCFWRAGQVAQAQTLFGELIRLYPDQAGRIQQVVAELGQDYAAQAS